MGNIIPQTEPTEEEVKVMGGQYKTRKNILLIMAIFHACVFMAGLIILVFTAFYNVLPGLTPALIHYTLPLGFFSVIIGSMYFVIVSKRYMPMLSPGWKSFFTFTYYLTITHVIVLLFLFITFLIVDFTSCGMVLCSVTGGVGWIILYWLLLILLVFDFIMSIVSMFLLYGMLRRVRAYPEDTMGVPYQRLSPEEAEEARYAGGMETSKDSKIGQMMNYVGTAVDRKFVFDEYNKDYLPEGEERV